MSDNPRIASIVSRFLHSELSRREFLREAAAIGLSATAAGVLLDACTGGGEQPSPSSPNGAAVSRTLRFGPAPDYLNYDTPTNPADYPLPPYNLIYEGLTTYTPGTWDPANLLAEELEVSPDAKTYTFTLKQGIPFHGGYGEVTAEDVKFSLERAAGLQKLYPDATKSDVTFFGADLPGLEEVKITGTYSGQVIFKKPFVPFTTLTLPYNTTGLVVSKKAVEELGRDFATRPIGTGPYELVSYSRNKEMVLRRFADYGGAAEAITPSYDWEEIHLSLVSQSALPTGQALTVPIRAGDVDFTPYLSALDAQQLGGSTEISIFDVPQNTGYNLLFINVQHPKLRDLRVRQAIRYAIDVPAIIDLTNESPDTRAFAVMGPGMVGHWADAPHYKRDVAKAQSLLQQAGVSSLELDLAAIAWSPDDSKPIGELIQSNLQDVGITTNIILSPPDNYTTDPDVGQLYYTGYTGAPDPYYQLEWEICSQVKVYNYSFWCEPEYDALYSQLGSTEDEAQRSQIAIQMQQLMDESAGFVWVSYPVGHYASSRNTQPAFAANGFPDLKLFKAS